MAIKFTFKKDTPTKGLASIGSASSGCAIKYKKQEVGYIYINDSVFNNDGKGWRVRIQGNNPKYPEEPCEWRWVTFTACFETSEQAKEWVALNSDTIYKYLADKFKKFRRISMYHHIDSKFITCGQLISLLQYCDPDLPIVIGNTARMGWFNFPTLVWDTSVSNIKYSTLQVLAIR